MKVQNTQKVIVSIRFRGNGLKVLTKPQSYIMAGGERENSYYDIVVMAELPSSSLSAMLAPCLYLDQTNKMNETMNYTLLDTTVPKMFLLDTELKKTNY